MRYCYFSLVYESKTHFVSFGWSFNFGWAPYGDKWRSQRKIFHQAFRAEAAIAYRPVQLKKARQLILDILREPHDFVKHIQRRVLLNLWRVYVLTEEICLGLLQL